MKRIGPGPAKYMLPPTIGYNNHDFTRERLPMYSMAPKFPYNKANVGPGAAKYNLEYKSHVGVKHINAYMGYQFVPLKTANVGPGPAKYAVPTVIGPERTRVWLERSPDAIMGRRLPLGFASVGPGPSKYLLPDTMGKDMKNIYDNKKPMYSMGARLKGKEYNASPGPAKYDPRIKDEHVIHISMKGRYPSHMASKSPGAARFNLQEYKPGKRPPQFSMGQRLNGIAQPMIIPGDNC